MNKKPIIAIGGIGGSGTRLLAELLQWAGVNIGRDLNISLDNLIFTVLFKNPNWRSKASSKKIADRFAILIKTLEGRRLNVRELFELHRCVQFHPFPHDIPPQFKKDIRHYLINRINLNHNIGWKEPNSYFYLREIFNFFDEVIYFHVVRNGLEMAFSKNTNQLTNWSSVFDIPLDHIKDTIENRQLKFWIASTNYILDLKKIYGHKIQIVTYDQLCDNPIGIYKRIVTNSDLPLKSMDELKETVKNWNKPTRNINFENLDSNNVIIAKEMYDKINNVGAD